MLRVRTDLETSAFEEEAVPLLVLTAERSPVERVPEVLALVELSLTAPSLVVLVLVPSLKEVLRLESLLVPRTDELLPSAGRALRLDTAERDEPEER